MRSRHLVTIFALLTLVSGTFSAMAQENTDNAPAGGGCLPGITYHPACDVNHDGVIDINDIQLTAGHWRQTGTYTSGSWDLLGNAGTNPTTNFLGTTDYVSLAVVVNNTAALRIMPATHASYGYSPNIVGGYGGNSVAFDAVGAMVGGGGSSTPLCGPNSDLPCVNKVNSDFGTVGGGSGNTAGGINATVSGGASNETNDNYATVGGGDHNTAGYVATVGGGKHNTANSPYAAIAGGENNTAGGFWATNGGGQNNTTSNFWATVGGGSNNVASGAGTTVSGGNNNGASGQNATVGGGTNNEAIGTVATIGGGSNNLADGDNATISGGYSNAASGYIATIGGGYENTVSGFWATVGGGYSNAVGGNNATVSGGTQNTANGATATVAGGSHNTASSSDATIGGGAQNTANGEYATVAGGSYNTASGAFAMAAGGYYNIASGQYSFAAGRRARASHDGTFVWADSTDIDYGSTAPDQFLIRAGGGVGIGTTTPQSTLQVIGNYIQFPTIVGAPLAADCDSAAEAGRVVVRTDGPPDLYICRGPAGWVSK